MPGLLARLAPGRAEAVRRPRPALAVDVRMIGPSLGAASSAALSGAPTGITTRRAGLRLPQPDVRPVIGRPRQPQEIALPLAGPQREQQRQVQMRGRAFEERGLVVDASRSSRRASRDRADRRARTGWPATAHDRAPTTVRGRAPSTHSRLAAASWRQAVAPRLEDAARAPVGERREREVAEFLLDHHDLLDVVGARRSRRPRKSSLAGSPAAGSSSVPLGRHHLAGDAAL